MNISIFCWNMTSDRFYAEGILRLYNVTIKRLSISKQCEDGYVRILCDTAVSALGKIFEYHRGSIGPKVTLLQLLFFHDPKAGQEYIGPGHWFHKFLLCSILVYN